ncbi:hypothetical protein K7W42_12990 [Deinococcus sp. HMF7604]|uniref:hypothetical protein n=1 Tax=Deinococcus betulae TaxID=2873312 RepID=UPI001CCD7BD6|nr:hypothetical protein [Deinococcus betulae]MBZ9751773.1 hypothetical protein [Deinococcus betulae]
MTTLPRSTCTEGPPHPVHPESLPADPVTPAVLAADLRRQAEEDHRQAALLDAQAEGLYQLLAQLPGPQCTAHTRVAFHLIEGAAQLRGLAQTRLTLAAHLDALSLSFQEPS